MVTWPDVGHAQNREFMDNVHPSITLHYPLNLVVDTKEFQRLRDLKQIGVANLVYSSAVHTRFCHSIGTFYLADTFMRQLRQYAELDIQPVDHLCVAVAALCHDLGHGPFSHMYDTEFRYAVGATEWSHEDGSIALLARIFDRPAVREAFEPFFGADFEKHLTFIKELINSKRIDDNNNWLAKGRDSNKSFLYDIVSNTNDKIDVDKWDYLLRDSKTCGISIAFDKDTVDRMIKNGRVLEYEGFKRICYADKVLSSIQNLFQSRQAMHENVYQHKTVKAIETLTVRALILANDYLKFHADDGTAYKLSEVDQDISAYIRATDSVVDTIKNSVEPGLAESRKILDDISERRIPKLLTFNQFTYDKAAQCLTHFGGCNGDNSTQSIRDVKAKIEQTLKDRLGCDFEKAGVLLVVKQADRGSGPHNPMERVVVYDAKSKEKNGPIPRKIDVEWIKVNCPAEAQINTLLLYGSRTINQELKEHVLRTYERVLKECGLKDNLGSNQSLNSGGSTGISA